jgi:hypothetical protein
MTTEIIPHTPTAPVNVAGAFDPAIPLPQRIDALQHILALAAHLSIERDRAENPDAYADEDFCRQEVKRRTLKGIEDLRQAANMMELRWAMENGKETWVDESGAEVSLLDEIEQQMPDEEERRSSGRARQLWSFAAGEHSAVAAFREQGIPDQKIAECNRSGIKSVLGIVSSGRKKLEDAVPKDELRQVYIEFIEEAGKTTRLQDLRKWINEKAGLDDDAPPPIPYSAEANHQYTWVVARMSEEQYLNLFWARMDDVLERNELLPQDFVDFWRQGVSLGQTENAPD